MNPLRFILEGLRFAVDAIRSSRQRSFLTMLGVGTGIFAITAILTMVNSLQVSVTSNLAALGNTTFFVHHWPWKDNSEDWFKYLNRPKVSYDDYQKLKDNLTNVEGVSYEVVMAGRTVHWRGREASNIQVGGVTEDMPIVKDLELEEGRYFTPYETQNGRAVCMVGYNIAQEIHPGGSAIGKYLQVGNKRLTIIGVFEKQGAALFGGNSEDDRVYVPYALAAKMYNLNQRMVEKVISVRASSHEVLGYVEQETIGLIRLARGLKPTAEDNFSINKQEALMEQFDSVFGYLETGGWLISLFSILIGGFSIGNIMYISVRERTQEIGVQKALGSTRGFILFQFLTEAVVICLLGGFLGLAAVFLLGSGVQVLLKSLDSTLSVYFSLRDVVIGLGLSVFIGLISGFIPATMAARLDPVIAMRHS